MVCQVLFKKSDVLFLKKATSSFQRMPLLILFLFLVPVHFQIAFSLVVIKVQTLLQLCFGFFIRVVDILSKADYPTSLTTGLILFSVSVTQITHFYQPPFCLILRNIIFLFKYFSSLFEPFFFSAAVSCIVLPAASFISSVSRRSSIRIILQLLS